MPKFQPKKQLYATVSVVSNEYYKENKRVLQPVGRVRRGISSFVVTANSTKGKDSFVADTQSLTKRTKNEIVRFFTDPSNDRKGSALLVVPKQIKRDGGGF